NENDEEARSDTDETKESSTTEVDDEIDAEESEEDPVKEDEADTRAEAYEEAKTAVQKAEKTEKQKDIDHATAFVKGLENEKQREELMARLEALKKPAMKQMGMQSTESGEEEEKTGLTFEMGKLTDLDGVKYSESNPLGPNDQFRLHMEWKLD